jgi:FkbM family methyltransferase
MIDPVRRWARRLGFDVIRWPAGTDRGSRLSQLIARLGVDTVLDVGAHEGDWAAGLRRLGYGGRIVSFEPGAAAFESLARRAARDDRWEVRRAAVGAENGSVSLEVRRNSMMSSVRRVARVPAGYAEQVAVVRTEEVPMVRLDAAWPSGRVMLKCDTQGLDLDVIDGCGRHLDDVVLLQLELAFRATYEGQPEYLEALERLQARGFRPAILEPHWWDEDGLLLEADCVLRR